ncbi:MAG: FtsQ-type POTRA domain-containing protein [Alphaproteobacteria bacterium]|nr:MAG: FtsQ-type POTRA domain-containing protein [Alphaproteobacteria bacterium]
MRPLTVDREDRVNGPARRRKTPSKSGGLFKGLFSGPKKKSKSKAPSKSEPRFAAISASAFNAIGNISLRLGDRIGGTGKPKKSATRNTKSTARRRPAPSWRKPAIICLSVLAIAAVVAGVSNFVARTHLVQASSDWIDAQQQALASALGLTVQEISVVGRNRTAAKDILRALDVKRGESLLNVDPEAARERLETLGWIEQASVMRRFPDELYIEITERRPFARWQLDGRTGVIDRSGAVVSETEEAEFSYLPKVVGPGANVHAAELFDMLSQTPELFTRLQNAVRVRDRRWNLEFVNKVTVLLPEKGTLRAWKELNRVQQKRDILDKGIVAIDLRASDRMYVRLTPETAKLRRTEGNET